MATRPVARSSRCRAGTGDPAPRSWSNSGAPPDASCAVSTCVRGGRPWSPAPESEPAMGEDGTSAETYHSPSRGGRDGDAGHRCRRHVREHQHAPARPPPDQGRRPPVDTGTETVHDHQRRVRDGLPHRRRVDRSSPIHRATRLHEPVRSGP